MRAVIILIFLAMTVFIELCAGEESLPIISSFAITSNPIMAGGSTALSWYVSGAKTITIDQGIGNVEFIGTHNITPKETTDYTLTATNDAGSITAIAECIVTQDQPKELILTSIASESGHVWSGNWNYDTEVGDTDANVGSQAFLSFDLSRIPRGSIIKNTRINFEDYSAHSENAFKNLGCLGAYSLDYGSHVNPAFYSSYPPSSEALLKFCSLMDIGMSNNDPELANVIQQKIGIPRLQLRFQFTNKETNYDSIPEIIDLGHNANLVINISSPVYPTGAGSVCPNPSMLYPTTSCPTTSCTSTTSGSASSSTASPVHDANYYLNIGNWYYNAPNKDYTNALKSYEDGINLKPSDAGLNADLWYGKGNSLLKLGKYNDALAAYDKTIGFKPSYTNAWAAKCRILRALHRDSSYACSKANA